jgi:hypothetical protein
MREDELTRRKRRTDTRLAKYNEQRERWDLVPFLPPPLAAADLYNAQSHDDLIRVHEVQKEIEGREVPGVRAGNLRKCPGGGTVVAGSG